MTVVYPSLVFALDQTSTASSYDGEYRDPMAEPPAEYSFTIKLDRIERASPTFTDTTDGYTGGKILHGTLVGQNVFEQDKLRGRGPVSVACPKQWNLRLLIWRRWCGVESGSEVQCRGTLAQARTSHQHIHTLATKIPDCYPVLGYVGLLILLSPIICILWPIMLLAKIFYLGLIVLLIARLSFFIWPNLMPNVKQFDIFMVIFVVLGGFLKFYWWAVNLGSADDNSEDSDATGSQQQRPIV